MRAEVGGPWRDEIQQDKRYVPKPQLAAKQAHIHPFVRCGSLSSSNAEMGIPTGRRAFEV